MEKKINFTIKQLEKVKKEFEKKLMGYKWEEKILVGKFCNITNDILDNQIKDLKGKGE